MSRVSLTMLVLMSVVLAGCTDDGTNGARETSPSNTPTTTREPVSQGPLWRASEESLGFDARIHGDRLSYEDGCLTLDGVALIVPFDAVLSNGTLTFGGASIPLDGPATFAGGELRRLEVPSRFRDCFGRQSRVLAVHEIVVSN
jgi:hypothetical protein